ncbi:MULTISPECIES: Ig-like domain-containing protein [Gammaproteobacteria]|uniref:Ig-like domain-containing protein n=1 Tax=Gammaproteobacteria TaxID=1236 RepID=UPI000DD07BAB|nr:MULTISPECIES: Ig-like domain-containing protein [Gammaproteobacteria]RTE86588.1 hypothetical protein DQX04_08520 [Aliidiomarina sp. B3213]TCZ90857.1 hypothetical protein EYQ95_08525 [Lysobacter sp. N42]
MKHIYTVLILATALALTGCYEDSEKNFPPAARDSLYTLTVDRALNDKLIGYDVNGDTLSFQVEQESDVGDLNVNSDGTFSFMPPAEFVGIVEFTYSVSDGVFSDEGIVSIVVEAEHVAASFYIREVFSQGEDADPLPLNGRIFNDDVTDTTAFDDLIAEGEGG